MSEYTEAIDQDALVISKSKRSTSIITPRVYGVLGSVAFKLSIVDLAGRKLRN